LKHRFLWGEIAELSPSDNTLIESESSPRAESCPGQQLYSYKHETRNREPENKAPGRSEKPDSGEPQSNDRHNQLHALLHEIAWRNKKQPMARSSTKLESHVAELENRFVYRRPRPAASMDYGYLALPKASHGGHYTEPREEQSNSGTSDRKRTTFDRDEVYHSRQHQRRRADSQGLAPFGPAAPGIPHIQLRGRGLSCSSHDEEQPRGFKTFKPKGFPTMVEELVSTVRRRKSKDGSEKRTPGTETDIEGESKSKRMKELQHGLLSLLSDLGNSKTVGPNSLRERLSPTFSSSQLKQGSLASVTAFCDTSSPRDAQCRPFSQRYGFSTSGIPPMTQKTKHGSLQVLPTGDLRVQLPSISPYIFNVSSHSDTVTVSDPRRTVWQGNADDLPWRWTRIYRYASRFVEICRSRIPSIAIEVDGMRGRIMLNGAFEAILTRGSNVLRFTDFQKHIRVFSVENGKENLKWEGPADEMPPAWIDLWHSSVALYRKCLLISQSSSFKDETERRMKYIPDLGWYDCGSDYIRLFCEDGARIDFNLQEQKIVYRAPGRKDELWDIDLDELPWYLSEKLEKLVRSSSVR